METPSSPDKVVAAIYRGILSGRIVPGQKLIEADLASTLEVSRGPIREALKRLQAEGVVENTRHRGAYVRLLSRKEAFDFLEILSLLTGFIARKAAEAFAEDGRSIAANHIASTELLREFRDKPSEDSVHHEVNRRFYEALMKVGGNSQISGIMPAMRIQLFRMQGHSSLTREGHNQRFLEFKSIAQHVLAGDPAKAQRAMIRHMRSTHKRLSVLPDDAFARD